MTQTEAVSAGRQFPCKQCGAAIEFSPGAQSLVCPHCGATNHVAGGSGAASGEGGSGDRPRGAASPFGASVAGGSCRVESLDFQTYARGLPEHDGGHETLVVKCAGCGAETTLADDTAAGRCQFCGAPVVAEAQSKKAIKPRGILPFAITRDEANRRFHQWIAGLWFAPSGLAKQADRSGISGVYIPCWTYDSDATTDYTGMRGDDYQEIETYTEFVNGKPEQRTRWVTKTRWSPAAGEVRQRFEDVLVLASESLPPHQAEHLEPWDLKNLVPYADEFLAGFACQTYQVDLTAGFERARQAVAPKIRRAVENNIGGNHQQILSMRSRFDDVTFKHILLPLWISAYLYQGKTYRFLVNARTGAVRGERPWSALKITILVIAIVLVIVVIALIVSASQSRQP
jgi:DNA-directed RNA polymerase subunit RPC12/RpoP